tara:strand:- start:224 stop:628 length:405 start_codon:yes stop_codon:yes gene_type:complete
MIVVNPNSATHTISIVPRFDVESVTKEVQAFVDRVSADSGIIEDDGCIKDSIQEDYLSLIVTDNFKSESVSLENTFEIQEGKVVLTFDYDFRSESRYDVVINYINTSEVIYRGIFIATIQEAQEYKLTKNKFYY